MKVNLALLGFGNVGQALASLLLQKKADLDAERNLTFRVTGIATGAHGIAINPEGINLEQALVLAEAGKSLTALSSHLFPTDSMEFIHSIGSEVLFESIPVNYMDGQPAISYLQTALAQGMHVISANKGPVVHAYRELTEFAHRNGRKYYFESAVMDGAPIFSLFREAIPAAKLLSLRGVLNSTTNLILCRMETGESMADAVAYAQSIGIAESDPSGDIDGWDAAIKVAALVTVLMETPLKPNQVERQGIRDITIEDITLAQMEGKRWKLVCSARKHNDHIQAQVKPEMVTPDSPLYRVDSTTSIVEFETDVLGPLTIVENEPGPHTTAYGMLADFLNAVK